MRDKIVEAIWDEIGCGYDGELIEVGDGADKILALICEEIEKVGNPNKNAVFEGDYQEGKYQGFENCRQKILALFK